MSENPLKPYIQKAKAVPFPFYILVLINFVLFAGLVCKELTIFYMFGTLVFAIMLITAIGCATNMWNNPTEMISENVKLRIEGSAEKIKTILQSIDRKQNDSSSLNTLVSVQKI